ncbi:MAG: hypothetical protein FJY29_01860 [Betaproteobacteria bacterium]|nr:hypothetical protein [Betaproteobacteria bacterium]
MARILVPVALAGLFVVASCGSSSSGKSENPQCTPANNGNLQGIRVPGTAPAPTTNPMPTTPGMDADTANAAGCEPAQGGNLGNAPTAPNVPGAPNTPNFPTNPNQPGMNNGSNTRTPAIVGNVNGRWELSSDFCEDGTQSPEMQQMFQMLINGNFNHQMVITETSIEEFTWFKVEVDPGNNDSMMCTLMRKSPIAKSTSGVRIGRPAANYDDAGGLTPCNVKPAAAETIENVKLIAQGGSLVVEFPNSRQCNGKSRLQLFSAKN